MKQLQAQGIRAVIDDLRIRVEPVVSEPTALATLGMVQYFLAHLQARKESPGRNETIAEELRRFDAEEQDENALSTQGTPSAHLPLTTELLEPYLRQRLGTNVSIVDLVATLGGFSKLTYIVHLSGAESIGNKLVVRRDPEFGPVEAHAAEEFRVLQVMHRHGVAVAEPLWADDPSSFGGSVLVSRCSVGESVFEKSATGLKKSVPAALALARVVAKMHQVPIAA